MADKIIDQFTSTDIELASSFSPKFTTANIALFSNDATIMPITDDYKQFYSFSDVEEYYVPSSRTYKMAKILFQNLNNNIASANGSIFLFPIEDVNATRPTITTIDLTPNLTNLIGVDNGEFQVVINGGNPIPFTKLNFTTIANDANAIKNIAEYLQIKCVDLQVDIINNTKLKFTNLTFGADATIVIEPLAGGTGINLTDNTYLNIANAIEVEGTNSTITSFKEQLENIVTLQNDLATVPVITTLDLIPNHILEIAEFLEEGVELASEKHIFFYPTDSKDLTISDTVGEINTRAYQKTFLIQTPAKDIQSLHNLISCFLATQLSVNYFTQNSEKLNLQSKNIDLTNAAINLVPSTVQTKLYKKYIKSTIANGVSAYLTTGSTRHFAIGLYTRGTMSLSFDQKLFEYNFENAIDNLNVDEIFAKNNLQMNNISIGIAKGIYEVQALDILAQNKVILPYTGIEVPFTVLPTSASKGLKDAEKRAIKADGYFIYGVPVESLPEQDKTKRILRFSFLLHTPAGVLKIESKGIAFDK